MVKKVRCIMSLSQKSRNIKAYTQSRLFIASLPCDTLWETLLILGFLLQRINTVQQICLQVWYISVLGRMPYLSPPWSDRNRTPDFLFQSPMPNSLHHGHSSLSLSTMLFWHRHWLLRLSPYIIWIQKFIATRYVERLTKLKVKSYLCL